MRKERTIEEVRERDRERQARWRAKNRVLSRERVAYVYGKAKWPQMVEERMKPETKVKYQVPGAAPAINRVIKDEEPEKIDDTRSYVQDPEDCRTDAEKRAYEARIKRWAPARRTSEPSEPGSAHEKAVEDLVALVARRKKVVEPKGGPGVEIKLDLER